MATEADSSLETGLPELPDWLKDDDERTESQAPADDGAAPTPDEGDGQPETPLEAAQRRDHAGRFTRSESSPTGFVESDARAQAAAPIAPTETDASEAEPFTYRADGRDYQIPGLTVPEAHAEQVRQLLSEGMHHRTTWQVERQAAQQREQQVQQWVQSEQTKFAAATEILRGLFSDREKLAAMYADWEVQGPKLMEQVRSAGLEAELNYYRSQEGQQVAQQAEQATQDGLWSSMSDLIDTRFPGIFDQYDMTTMFSELSQEKIVQVADRDYPEYGYEAGDILLDEAALYGKMAMKATEVTQRDRAARLAADKVAKTASRNAAVMGQGRRPPPTVGARSGQVPAGQRPPVTDAKSWQRDLENDDD